MNDPVTPVNLFEVTILGGLLVLVVGGVIRYLLVENKELKAQLKATGEAAIAAAKAQSEAQSKTADAQAKTILALEIALAAAKPKEPVA